MSYKEKIVKVEGDDKGVFLFTLSTCMWCRKTKKFLKELGVGHDYIDVDLLEGGEKEKAKKEMKKYYDEMSFPLIVINGKSMVGHDEEKIREALE